MFKIIPLPRFVQERENLERIYSFPEISNKYLGLSEDLQYYVTPDQIQVDQCTKPLLIIRDTKPIICPVDEAHARCEVDIFKNRTDTKCNFKVTSIINPIREHIPHSDTWIFSSVLKNEVVTITCNINNVGVMQYVTELRLNSSGTITLSPDCKAVGSSFTLLPRDKQKLELYSHNEYSFIIP